MVLLGWVLDLRLETVDVMLGCLVWFDVAVRYTYPGKEVRTKYSKDRMVM